MIEAKEELEALVEKSFNELGIDGKSKESMKSFLKIIELKDNSSSTHEFYPHSLRTGPFATIIAMARGYEPRPMLYAGLLHDIGKIAVDNGLLCESDCFDEQKMEKMKAHVLNGYYILKGIHDFAAEILLWHHYFKPSDPYPTKKEITKLQSNLPKHLKQKAKEYGLLLAIADVYDSLICRNNGRYKRKLVPEETKDEMLRLFPKNKKIIKELYNKRILGTDYDGWFGKIKKHGLMGAFKSNSVQHKVSQRDYDQKHR